jgi:hypothetical protein
MLVSRSLSSLESAASTVMTFWIFCAVSPRLLTALISVAGTANATPRVNTSVATWKTSLMICSVSQSTSAFSKAKTVASTAFCWSARLACSWAMLVMVFENSWRF